MLVLSRRKGQTIRIGDDIEIIVKRVHRSSVKLAIRAPAGLLVLRGEHGPPGLLVLRGEHGPPGEESENEPLESVPVVDAEGTVSPASRVPGEPGVKGQPGSGGQDGSPCPHHGPDACCAECLRPP